MLECEYFRDFGVFCVGWVVWLCAVLLSVFNFGLVMLLGGMGLNVDLFV